eukprot:7382035-Prymnesium_polylepis.1
MREPSGEPVATSDRALGCSRLHAGAQRHGRPARPAFAAFEEAAGAAAARSWRRAVTSGVIAGRLLSSLGLSEADDGAGGSAAAPDERHGRARWRR